MKQGFSLVELSIVLVILGLLVGGVLGGQSLIKAAELRSITEDHKEYVIAVNAFKGKYRGLPGDLRNAGRFWGYVNQDGADGNCDDIFTDVGTGTETCDGNGNARLDTESFRFWQHLGNAGLVAGSYLGGLPSGDPLDIVAGIHMPEARYQGATWGATELEFTGGTLRNAFLFTGGFNATTLFTPILTAEETWNIDSKFDDGRPGRGRIISLCDFTAATLEDPIDPDSEYDLQDTSISCVMGFAM